MCSEHSTQTETDLGSSLHDECKQTILKRICIVEVGDKINRASVTPVWTLGAFTRSRRVCWWLTANIRHQYGATAAATHQLVIQMYIFGWPWRVLCGSANTVTDMRVITSWLIANLTICYKESLQQWKGKLSAHCAPQKEKRSAAWSSRISISLGALLCMHFCEMKQQVHSPALSHLCE